MPPTLKIIVLIILCNIKCSTDTVVRGSMQLNQSLALDRYGMGPAIKEPGLVDNRTFKVRTPDEHWGEKSVLLILVLP